MDTLKEYIKQCEKAKKIQEIYDIKDDISYFYGRTGIFSSCLDKKQLKDGYIWLPSQAQLQKILNVKSAYVLHNQFDYYLRENAPYNKDASMEQLWLAFVMKEKYNKVWNGEEWIKE